MCQGRLGIAACAVAALFLLSGAASGSLLDDGEAALAADQLKEAAAAFEAYADDEGNRPELRAAALRGLGLANHYLWLDGSCVMPLCRSVALDPAFAGTPGVTKFVQTILETDGCSEEFLATVDDIVAAAAGHPVAEHAVRNLESTAEAGRGDREAVEEVWSEYEDISGFLVVGPFPNVGGSGQSVAYPPEYEIDLGATYYDRIGRPVRWQVFDTGPRALLDFDMWFDDEPDAVGYALVYVRPETPGDVCIHIKGYGTTAVWVNDSLVHLDDDPTAPGARLYDIPVTLGDGWSRIILKAGAERDHLGWFLGVRDAAGLPLHVETSTDPAVYETALPTEIALASTEGADLPRGMDVFSKQHFLREWYDRADQLRLADLVLLIKYLYDNGKAVAAEGLLEVGDERFPGSAILDLCRADLLAFRERYGEATAIRRNVAERVPAILEATAGVMIELIGQGDVDAVLAMVEEMEAEESPSRYHRMFAASLQMRRGAVAEGLAALEELFLEAPGDQAVRGNYLAALQMIGMKRDYEEQMRFAVEKRPDDLSLIRQYASVAYERGDYEEALEMLRRALAFSYRPDWIYLEMATVLEADGRPEEAADSLRQALVWSPVSVSAHRALASALMKLGRMDEALEHLETAAERNPYSLELRTMIRDAQGKPPLRDYFKRESIADLSSQDMSWVDGAAEAVRLIDAADIIVYPDGAHDIRHYWATKVLTESGVEEFRKMDTPVFWSNSEGQIEIARTIKADGREIDAERGYGEIAFSDVEPGDVLEYRYSVRYPPEVGLKGHFWDHHYFQFHIPGLLSRLAILSPEDMDYEWVCHNEDIEREVTRHDEWKLSVWEAREIQRDAVEFDMPAAEERIAWVDVSTIRSWDDIVQWYDAQSRGRVRASDDVKALAAELAGGATDDSTRIHRVAHHVMTEIRYEGGQFSVSAHVPRAAEEVLRTGFGDCKDQSCLMISLLREMGIEAGFALVNSRDETTVPYLPSPRFTHAIVRAVTDDGRVFWIDPTSIGLAFPNVPVSLEGAQALLIDPRHPEFVILETEPAATNGYESSIHGVLQLSGRMAMTGEVRYRGEDASGFRMLMHHLPEYREQLAESMLTEPHPGAVVSSSELAASGDVDSPVTLEYEVSLAAAASRAGDLLILNPPWTIGGAPFDMVSTEEREEPLVLDSWKGLYRETIVVELPEGCTPIEELTSVEASCGHGEFTMTRQLEDGVLTLVNTLRIDSIRVEPEDYVEFRAFIEKAWRAEQEPIVLRIAS